MASKHWFAPQRVATARAGPGRNQDPEVLSSLSHGWKAQGLEPGSDLFPSRSQEAGWKVEDLELKLVPLKDG